MKLPILTAPRFGLVKRAVQSVLSELGNPEPPISIDKYIRIRKWPVLFKELEGPDGYTIKIIEKKRSRFVIFIATDTDSSYDELTMKRRQNFTKAHELGHILLHGQFDLSSPSDMSLIDERTALIMEREANRFASHLLMPTYIFRKVSDLLPNTIVERCDVNVTAANIRIMRLTQNIKDSLLQSVRLDQWPPIEEFELPPDPPREARFASWEAYETHTASKETAASKQPIAAEPSAWDLVNSPGYMRLYEKMKHKNEAMLDKWRRTLEYD